GRTSAEIANRLFISPRTAEGHRANLMKKLGLQNNADLIRLALKRGILPMDG
ncbi:MAG: helix-turn-helix transcriptional regulator, partial [Acidobacteriota bacterium]